jgi:hypothetical protein
MKPAAESSVGWRSASGEHKDGTLAQIADELKHRYPDHPEEMAVVLRGMMAADLRRRIQPDMDTPTAGVPR